MAKRSAANRNLSTHAKVLLQREPANAMAKLPNR